MLFHRNPRKTGQQLETQIRALLETAECARTPGADAAAYNSAGDLCVEAGLTERALSCYGLAIDAFLKVARWDAAAGVCRKVLRLSPQAVRARCTLAWLAIGKQMSGEANVQIRGYVDAAVKAGRDTLAVAQLRRMGDAAASVTVRQAVAEHLLRLGAAQAAEHIFGIVHRQGAEVAPAGADSDMLWSTVRRAALLGPRELNSR